MDEYIRRLERDLCIDCSKPVPRAYVRCAECAKLVQRCRWFLNCTAISAGTIHHPVLGDVPACQKCLIRVQGMGQ